jgi:hypothetical protein
MKTLFWSAVLLAGFGLMLASYYGGERIAHPTPWTDAFMYVGDRPPAAPLAGMDVREMSVRLLPPSERVREFEQVLASAPMPGSRAFGLAFREKLVLDPGFGADFTESMLASGRLPRSGSGEVLAGWATTRRHEFDVDGCAVKVVGVLDCGVTLFADCYVFPPYPGVGGADCRMAYVLLVPKARLLKPATRESLAAAFPSAKFTPVAGQLRVSPTAYFIYLAGMGLLLLGGSMLFIRLYGWLAVTVRWRPLRAPLDAMQAWPRLLVAVHAATFGTYLLLSAVSYFVPEVQYLALAAVQQEIQSGEGPLGWAGKAYMTSIPVAAATTLAINLLGGSLLSITVPGIVIPGIGFLITWLRAACIGVILAPTMVLLAGSMLPHSLTLLVEMEAYILAGFFALMVPVRLFTKTDDAGLARRWGGAILLNAKAYLLIAAVLAVAAVYEATEVILQAR